MLNDIRCIAGKDMTPEFERSWRALFARCFGASEDKATLLLRKYTLNNSRLCVLFENDNMVACYAGLELPFGEHRIFLSTDTMSDGTRKKASVLLGTHLYGILAREGVLAVCGYPNDKIRALRVKYLDWTLNGGISLYLGIPLLWRLHRCPPASPLWRVTRPPLGFFSKPRKRIALLGRGALYRNGPALVLTLNATRPGPFFLRVPHRIVARRTFGYRMLDITADPAILRAAIPHLDLDTIDIP